MARKHIKTASSGLILKNTDKIKLGKPSFIFWSLSLDMLKLWYYFKGKNGKIFRIKKRIYGYQGRGFGTIDRPTILTWIRRSWSKGPFE